MTFRQLLGRFLILLRPIKLNFNQISYKEKLFCALVTQRQTRYVTQMGSTSFRVRFTFLPTSIFNHSGLSNRDAKIPVFLQSQDITRFPVILSIFPVLHKKARNILFWNFLKFEIKELSDSIKK